LIGWRVPIDKLAGEVELRHCKFEPAECWVLDGDEAYQVGQPDVVTTAVELKARSIPKTRTGIGGIVHIIVHPESCKASGNAAK
jgi:hypothetical protein